MSGCEGCEALRKAASSVMPYMTANDDILCGYHASELRKENERLRDELLRDELDDIGNLVGEDDLCIRWIEVWKGIRVRCKMAESWVGHSDPHNPYFHSFLSGRR